MLRLAVHVYGIVQGVGFRPFVHETATKRGLTGWVQNRGDGVRLEVQGPDDAVRDFVATLRREPPPTARVERIETAEVAPTRAGGFAIVASADGAAAAAIVPADQATCAACLAEVAAPEGRRHRYPFTNCARCGPRYTIIESLPYDRPRTSMRGFVPCAACAAEYGDPADRRFHAQPIACPACGPRVRLLSRAGEATARESEGSSHGLAAADAVRTAAGHAALIATNDAALVAAAAAIRSGGIVAVKGVGGFHLVADATDGAAVARLRARKGREEKPFAVMFPSLGAVRQLCAVSPSEAEALTSPAAPIVLLRRLAAPERSWTIADAVAPGNPWLGALLPYTPLHRLLLDAVGRPVVCTSGNRSEEPICIDDREALARLATIADRFLVHDRPIVRPVDDSVLRVQACGPQLVRRARGFAPLPLASAALDAAAGAPCVLALGAQLKSTIAIANRGRVVVSQHLGDLGTVESALLLERTVADLVRFLDARPDVVACDLHPDYASTRVAERLATEWSVPLERVQHHHAHVAAVVAERGLAGPVLGLAWDGAGLGSDGTLWGGEALVVDGGRFRRVAHLRPFLLPGGERAIREPRRAALGLLHEIFGDATIGAVCDAFAAAEARTLVAMLERRVQSVPTTSVGRLFDAVAALTGVRRTASFEGQAAMALEHAADRGESDGAYPFPLRAGDPAIADWEPLVRALLRDRAAGVAAERMAARFHDALASLAEAIAMRAGLEHVVLSGGCFQSLQLTSGVQARLAARGFTVHVPRAYPPNDGGISLGQALVALRRSEERSDVSRHTG